MIEIFQTILAGLIGTAAMSSALYLLHWRGLAEADMIRAIGSIVTRNEANALPLGVAIHFVSGVVFAFLYILVWSTLPIDQFGQYVLLGLVTGFAHGLVVSFSLVILVAEHHPLERFQQAGMGVAVAHLVGHVVYGLLVGIVAGSYLVRLDYLPKLLG
jgi:uncharacterized membrane protein YagU involved in acid resistance